MKTKTGMTVIVLLLTWAFLTAGFFMPDFTGKAADQNLAVQTERFAIEKMLSSANARLTDMLILAKSFENEIYLNSGSERDEAQIKTIASDIINRLTECKILDKIRYEDISIYPFIAVRGEMFSDAAFGYDDMDNSAIDNVEENTPDVSDQKGSEDSVQMGILWNCSVTDAQIGGGLTMLIDDRSGKLLSFSFTRNQDDSAMEDDESEKEKYVEVIQEDLQTLGGRMEIFCEKYYGFRHEKTEFYIDDAVYFVRMYYEGENGDEIMLDLKRDQLGTWYSWN